MSKVRFMVKETNVFFILTMILCLSGCGEYVTLSDLKLEPCEEVTLLLPGDVPLVLRKLPAGKFMMGRYPDEPDSERVYEDPQHEVTISKEFFMGKYEVTQEQWLSVMSWSRFGKPSEDYGVGAKYPAYNVSWYDVQSFISALNFYLEESEQDKIHVRLPTEAEWEYSCRAGTTTRFYFGDSLDCTSDCWDCAAGTFPGNRTDYMWYCGNMKTFGCKPVGKKLPNAFGLYDMSGNVWEWCQDWYGKYPDGPVTDPIGPDSGTTRVNRGGYWRVSAHRCRSAARHGDIPDSTHYIRGFRLAGSIMQKEDKPVEQNDEINKSDSG